MDLSSFQSTVAAAQNAGGSVPLNTLQGGALYARPTADSRGLIVGVSAGSPGTITNFVQATCSGTVYGLDVVLTPPA